MAGESEGRQLRVALAMRGGVSLAVWIGGGDRRAHLVRRGTLNDTSSLKAMSRIERIPTRSC